MSTTTTPVWQAKIWHLNGKVTIRNVTWERLRKLRRACKFRTQQVVCAAARHVPERMAKP